MSSLAAVQADGFYHPPEWDPRKESLKKFTGSKGHNQYLQSGVIRFEMPYHVWCLKCESHIGKGVRFNAKKIEAGKYFSTKIWEFQMKCATCKALLVIRTDPKNCDYQMVEGLRRKEQGYDEEDIGLKPLATESTSTAVSVDPIMALERSGDEKRKAEKESEYLNRLIEHKRATEQDNYGANALLRRSMRSQKRARDAVMQESRAKGVGYDLLPASTKDAEEASTFSFTESRHENFRKSAKAKIASIMGSSIFGDSYKKGQSSSSTSGRELVPAGKKVERAASNRDLAVKRAKQGIDVRQFVVDDCVDGAPSLLALVGAEEHGFRRRGEKGGLPAQVFQTAAHMCRGDAIEEPFSIIKVADNSYQISCIHVLAEPLDGSESTMDWGKSFLESVMRAVKDRLRQMRTQKAAQTNDRELEDRATPTMCHDTASCPRCQTNVACPALPDVTSMPILEEEEEEEKGSKAEGVRDLRTSCSSARAGCNDARTAYQHFAKRHASAHHPLRRDPSRHITTEVLRTRLYV